MQSKEITKIVYCTPSIYIAGGVERVLTTKVNYLANQVDKYDVTIILTDGADKKPFYQLSDKVKVINLNIILGSKNCGSCPSSKRYLSI